MWKDTWCARNSKKHTEGTLVFVVMKRFMNEITFEVDITLGCIRYIVDGADILVKP